MAATPTLSDPEALTALRTCVHCGICLPQCPTYRVLGEEMDSPRGRLYLMRAVAEGRLPITEQFTRHLDLCLGCRACETACPAGVRYGSLLETARADIERHGRPARHRFLMRLLFAVFPRPERLGPLMGLTRGYQRWGLQGLVRRSGVLARFPRLAAMDALLARVPEPATLPEYLPARGKARGRVAVLAGCVQRHLFPDVNHDTVQLLSLAGWDVVVPRGQGCCGALELHAGQAEQFRERARALLAALPDDVEFVVTNAAGCGAAMRDYGHWLPGAAAARLAGRVRDVSEVLAEAPLPLGPLPLTVAYHDACHLAHAQRIREPPRTLLRSIPGLELVEIPDGDQCCGSAGIYNLVQPESARQIGERKADNVLSARPDRLCSANPGCTMQIQKILRSRGIDLPTAHPIELLDASITGRGPA